MLLQYRKIQSTDSNRLLSLAILFIEAILISIEFFAYFISVFAISRYQFHFNLKMALGYAMLAYCIDIIARLVIISFEVGAFTIPDEVLKSEGELLFFWTSSNNVYILLAVCSLYRVSFMVLVVSISLVIAIERYFATIWVSTYEAKKHKWISIVLVPGNIFGCFIGSTVFHFEVLNLLFLISLAVILNLISLISFISLYNLNDTNLKYCQTRKVHKSYTLSLRFQLNENLKVMKWLKNSIILMAGFNITLAGFLVAANDEYIRTNNESLSKNCHLFLNFGIAVYGQAVVFVALLSDRHFRRIFLRFNLVRTFTKPFFGRIFPKDFEVHISLTTSEETNVYFNSLSSQWDNFGKGGENQKKEVDVKKKKMRRKRGCVFPKRSDDVIKRN